MQIYKVCINNQNSELNILNVYYNKSQVIVKNTLWVIKGNSGNKGNRGNIGSEFVHVLI